MSVAVITSIYGGYDTPKVQPAQTVDAEWILVTEQPDPGYSFDWHHVREPRPHMHPCLAAKVAKCLPHLYTDADTIVWMDGSCQLLRPDSLEQIIGAARSYGLAQVAHPDRDCIYDEAAFCEPIHKYAGLPMAEQVEHYRKAGHPAHAGLWATGLIVYTSVGSRHLRSFGEAWLLEQLRWGFQDQLSQAPVARRLGPPIDTLPFPLHGSGLFEWHVGHH